MIVVAPPPTSRGAAESDSSGSRTSSFLPRARAAIFERHPPLPVSAVPPFLAEALRDRYRLERELGRGGMATVYLAEDLKHGRKVAVKVLRPELAAGMGTGRFLREIEVAARLQHPGILPLHDSGEAADQVFYIMPYVEGESLRTRLARGGALPVDEAVRLLCELLDALVYAHAKGVVHRDIKPDNILLSGRHAMLVDFGVAKALSDATGPEILTTTGVALGTASYMPPEQAFGSREVDHRADLYAVGVVGYELLAGRLPFTGSTAQAIVAAQLTRPADDLRAARPDIPEGLAHVVMRALERRPDDRWSSAADMLARLEPFLGTAAEPRVLVDPRRSLGSPRPRPWVWATGGALLLAGLAALALTPREDAAELRLGRRTQVTLDPGLEIEPAIAPDGQLVAYAAGPMQSLEIRVRRLDGGTALAVAPQSERPQRFPSWSPDGGRILFRSPRGLEVVSALGGSTRIVVADELDPAAAPWETVGPLLPASWSPDGASIAFVRSDTLYAVRLEGGPPRPLTSGGELHSCAWSPDGRWIACVRGNRQSLQPSFFYGNRGAAAIWLIPVDGGEPVQVTAGNRFHASPTWAADGQALLFVSNRDGGLDLYQLALDRAGTPRGAPVRLTTGLEAEAVSLAAKSGMMAYSVFEETSNVWSLPIPENPPVSVREATPVTTGNQLIEQFDVSPDGRWLAFDSDRGGNNDIWRQPIGGGESVRLTEDPAEEFWPRWSPDGREIAFHGFRGSRRQLFVMSAEGRDRRQISDGTSDDRTPSWGPDGRTVLYLYDWHEPHAELRAMDRDAQGAWSRPRTLARRTTYPAVASPDGRLVAFGSADGLWTVGANGDSARLVARSGAEQPLYTDWSSDGRTIYYLAMDSVGRASIWSVPRAGGPPRLEVEFDDPTRQWHRYGFLVRGGRFYFTLGDRQSDVWAAEVRVSASPGE
jgi:eukaryotic-like serine/threonine-protein kinase